jgi:hypothetical protein
MRDIKLPDGIMAKKPHENAPDFVKAKIMIKRQDAINWLNGQSKEWINLDLKESQRGAFYLSVDEWQPNTSSGNETPPPDETDDLPFN